MGGPGGRPGSHVHLGALLSGTDGLVGFLVCVGLLQTLLLGDERDEGHHHGVVVPDLLREVLWDLVSVLWYRCNSVDLGTDGYVFRVSTIREI